MGEPSTGVSTKGSELKKGPERTNLGQRHDHEIRIEVLHEIQVLNIEAYVTEATDFRCHLFLHA